MIKAHKIALDPNDRQLTSFRKAAGCARVAANWALDEWKAQYAAGEKPSEISLRRKLNSIKRAEFPWMSESSKNVPQQAIKNLGTAFTNFFKKRAKYPRYRKKGLHDSFRADGGPGTFEVAGNSIRLPRIGWIRMRESLRLHGKLLSATVSRRAQRWYVSIQVEVQEAPFVRKNHGTVGVDLGVKTLATLSTGEHVEGPKPLKAARKRLRLLSKSVSRKKKGSKNREKAKAKLAKQHARVHFVRQDFLHKLTTSLVERFDVIAIENLNTKGMMRNHKLARAISDMGFFEFRRQLEYKALWYGTQIVVADRWFASSKTCSACGTVLEELSLSVREWTCPDCGAVHDRDVNAAINLKNLAGSSPVSACRPGSAGSLRKKRVKLLVGQELNATDSGGIGG